MTNLITNCQYNIFDKFKFVIVMRKDFDLNKLRFDTEDKITLISAKFDASLIDTSKVTSSETKMIHFFGIHCMSLFII